ncbi:hypothetical protein E4U41_005299 [Claviceps citrina]|nr:hypothetical protein E4U41_005299 [Claviceps citrina]
MAPPEPSFASCIRYRPLNQKRNEIRLLEVQPPLTDDVTERVACRLVHERLDEAPEFAGLSTLYGAVSETECIEINGAKMTVPLNVAEALRHIRAVFLEPRAPQQSRSAKMPAWLRSLLKNAKQALADPSADQSKNNSRPPPLRIWLDLLCINRRDAKEEAECRTALVRAYRHAQVVIGWLGPADDTTALAIDIIRSWDRCMPANFGEPGDREAHPENYAPILEWMAPVAHLSDIPEGITDPREVPSYKAISTFLTRPYFRNAWMLDHMALASFPTFLVGDEIVSWKQILRLNRVNEDIKDHGADMFPDDLRHLLEYMPLNSVCTFLKEFDKRQRAGDQMPPMLTHTSSGTISPSVSSFRGSNTYS